MDRGDAEKGSKMIDADQLYLTGVAEDDKPFVPHESEEGPYAPCWTCHGFLIGPPGRRLCGCHEPAPLAPALAEKVRALEGLRDVLAEGYRHRWFGIILPLLDSPDEDEGRLLWRCLWPVARKSYPVDRRQ